MAQTISESYTSLRPSRPTYDSGGLSYPDLHLSLPSFNIQSEKSRVLPLHSAARKEPVNRLGCPIPRTQVPDRWERHFVNDKTWDAIVDQCVFDDIVVGSGFCGLAYVTEALERDPHRKILILERGGLWSSDQSQDRPKPCKMFLGGPSPTFPWQLTSKTLRSEIKYMHGSCPFFGGRSTFWAGWCPQPSLDLLRDFPPSMLETAKDPKFWRKAKDLLNVTPASKLFNGPLQENLESILRNHLADIPTADHVETGPLAVADTAATSTLSFVKFSTPEPLLALQEKQRQLAKLGRGSPLTIASEVAVQSFVTDPDHDNAISVLKTSRGDLRFPERDTNVILANGAIPAATTLFNSLESMQERAGKRLTGHNLTHIDARFLIDPVRFPNFGKCPVGETCRGRCGHTSAMAATYLAGKDPKTGMQYHIQITAMHSPHPVSDTAGAGRTRMRAQLEGSDNHIILVCATLGELNENNRESWVRRDLQNPDPTTNIELQVTLDATDDHLWQVMDQATYDAIAVMAGSMKDSVEYWNDDPNNRGWCSDPPPRSKIHVPGVIHECSTLYMGPESDPHAAVDESYRPYGCRNVYVTGSALFPTAGSWNTTLTMCGYAQDLARKIVPLATN